MRALQRLLFIAVAILPASACTKFNNIFNESQNSCGISEWKKFEGKAFFQIRDEHGKMVDVREVARAEFFSDGARLGRKLEPTPGSCLALDISEKGRLEVAIPSRSLAAARAVFGNLAPNEVEVLTVVQQDPVSVKLPCPKKATVAKADDLQLPIALSAADISRGVRFFLEASHAGRSLLLKAEASALRLEQQLPDGEYAITLRAVDLLGRSVSSPSCLMAIDSHVPSSPELVGPALRRAGESFRLEIEPGSQGFVCIEGPGREGSCLAGGEYRQFVDIVSLPEAGRAKVYAFSRSASGVESPIVSFLLGSDAKAPVLKAMWKNSEFDPELPLVQNFNMEFHAAFEAMDDLEDARNLKKKLECRVNLSTSTSSIANESVVECLSEECMGRHLSQFRRCGSELRFRVRDAEKYANHRIDVIARVADDAGHQAEAVLSAWLLQDMMKSQWWENLTEGGISSGDSVAKMPGDWKGLLFATASGLLGAGPADFNLGGYLAGTWNRSTGKVFVDSKGNVWISWIDYDSLNPHHQMPRVTRFPLARPSFVTTWEVSESEFDMGLGFLEMSDGSVSLVHKNGRRDVFKEGAQKASSLPLLDLVSPDGNVFGGFLDERGRFWVFDGSFYYVVERSGAVSAALRVEQGSSTFVVDGDTLWVGTPSEIQAYELKNNQLKRRSELTVTKRVLSMSLMAPGRIAAVLDTLEENQNLPPGEGTTKILSHIDGTWSEGELLRGLRQDPGRFVFDGSGALWSFGWEEGIRKYRGCEWVHFDAALLGLRFGERVKELVSAPEVGLAFLTSEGRVGLLRSGRWEIAPFDEPISKIHVSSEGEIWGTVSGKVWYFYDKVMMVWRKVPVLEPSEERGPGVDEAVVINQREGAALWFVGGKVFLTSADGHVKDKTRDYPLGTLFVDRMGTPWSYNQDQWGMENATFWENGGWKSHALFTGFPPPWRTVDASQPPWMISENAFFVQDTDGAWKRMVALPHGHRDHRFTGQPTELNLRNAILDKSGNLWLATGYGIFRGHPEAGSEKWEKWSGDNGNLHLGSIVDVEVDSRGRVWAAGESGIALRNERCPVLPEALRRSGSGRNQ